MKNFRKIIIDNVEYQWLFRYQNLNYANSPYLLILNNSFSEQALHIYFPITEKFLLNIGLPAIFEGKEVTINLNRPFYISQIINYYKKNKIESLQPEYKYGCNYLNGIRLLQKIGYTIPSIYL